MDKLSNSNSINEISSTSLILANEESKIQKHCVICPRLHRWYAAGPGFETRWVCCKALALFSAWISSLLGGQNFMLIWSEKQYFYTDPCYPNN